MRRKLKREREREKKKKEKKKRRLGWAFISLFDAFVYCRCDSL